MPPHKFLGCSFAYDRTIQTFAKIARMSAPTPSRTTMPSSRVQPIRTRRPDSNNASPTPTSAPSGILKASTPTSGKSWKRREMTPAEARRRRG